MPSIYSLRMTCESRILQENSVYKCIKLSFFRPSSLATESRHQDIMPPKSERQQEKTPSPKSLIPKVLRLDRSAAIEELTEAVVEHRQTVDALITSIAQQSVRNFEAYLLNLLKFCRPKKLSMLSRHEEVPQQNSLVYDIH